MKVETLPNRHEFEVFFRGTGRRSNPFVPRSLTNEIAIGTFFNLLPFSHPENGGYPLFLEVFTGQNETHFIIEACRDCYGQLTYNILLKEGYLPSKSVKDYFELQKIVNKILPNPVEYNLENISLHERHNNSTKVLLDSEPYLDITMQIEA